jgi:poly(3-hydroxybutyrate) depolymerase
MNKMFKLFFFAIVLALGAWMLFFKTDGWRRLFLNRHADTVGSSQVKKGIVAQGLNDDSDDNFLLSFGEAAETASIEIPIEYNNNGVVTSRTIYLRTVPGFAQSQQQFPLLFAYHGTSPDGSAAALDLANKNADAGAIIIALVGGKTADGKNASWNASGSTDQDDVAFTQKVFDMIKSDTRVNLNMVGAWGGSVGSSFVSNKLSIGVDFLKFIGCFSSTLLDGADVSAAPSPLTVINAHGENDPLVPIDGGATSFSPYMIQMSEEAAVALWVNHNNAALKKTVTTGSDSYETWSYSCEFKENASYKKYSYSWSDGAVVQLWRLKNIGHASQGALINITGQSTAAFLLDIFRPLAAQ